MALSPRESENACSEISTREFSTGLSINRETVQIQRIKEKRKETNREDKIHFVCKAKMKVHGYSPAMGLA